MTATREVPLFKVFMAESVVRELAKTLHSGYVGEGPKVVEFETALAVYLGTPRLLTCNAGTSALHLAYHMAIDHAKDAEVISTPITCTATNTPILNNGARIVWADVDPVTGSIDPADVERKITDRTRAIAVVHWGGNPCDLARINAIAAPRGITVIEDNAHGWGSAYRSKPIGNHSDFAVYSLQAIKHVTSVDGGLLVCRSEADYRRGKLLRWYGIDREIKDATDLRCEIDVAEAGYKFHMNDVAATIGLENFKHLDEIVGRHRANAKFYDAAFRDRPSIRTVPENPDGSCAYWFYTLHADNRDELMASLKAAGIGASKVHARNDTHSMFKAFRTELKGAERFHDTHLCIPVGWWVSDEDRAYVADKVIEYARANR